MTQTPVSISAFITVAALLSVALAGCASSNAPAGGTGLGPGPASSSGSAEAPPELANGPSPAAPLGAYSALQADRGKEVFTDTCTECHFTSEMRNTQFQLSWKLRTAWDFHREMVRTMPEDTPGSLTNQQYIDVTAYILQLNGHPAGDTELVRDEAVLRAISMKKHEGTPP